MENYLWIALLAIFVGWAMASKVLRMIVIDTFLHPIHPTKIEKDEEGNVRIVPN